MGVTTYRTFTSPNADGCSKLRAHLESLNGMIGPNNFTVTPLGKREVKIAVENSNQQGSAGLEAKQTNKSPEWEIILNQLANRFGCETSKTAIAGAR